MTFQFVATMDDVVATMLLPARVNGFADDLPLFDEVARTAADGPA